MNVSCAVTARRRTVVLVDNIMSFFSVIAPGNMLVRSYKPACIDRRVDFF